jgi:pimeloyl-ACP methyl ester carboxylesterase
MSRTAGRPRAVPLALAAALLTPALLTAAACGSDETPAPDAVPAPTTAAARPTAYPIEERCTGQGASGEAVFLSADDGSTVSAAAFGDGDRAAVFVHQTGITGLCGWVPYAAWAARRGIRAVVVDVCGYGRSACTEALDADPAAQLALAVDWARTAGSSAVTVVGASMGGSLAAGAGEAAGADAVVDISGPADWEGVPSLEESVPETRVPLLLVFARADRPDDWRRARAAARGTGAVFVDVPGAGHGYSIVTDGSLVDARITAHGRRVLAWVNGEYAAAR